MEKRRLGRTGHMSTVVILGTAAFSKTDENDAGPAMELAIKYGINHIDVAPSYGNAEVLIAPALKRIRDQVFLGCKTGKRTRDDARRELENSLRRLGVDRLDLYQMHAVTTMEHLNTALGPGGAIETFKQARDEGLTKWLGITGHGFDAPRIQIEALKRFDFDTVMFPLNFVQMSIPQYRKDVEELLALAQSRDVGVQIIKALAKAPWGEREQTYRPWYEPHDDPSMIQEAVNYVLSQPVTGFTSAADSRLWPAIFAAAEDFKPMSALEQDALLDAARDFTPLFSPATPSPI